MRDRSLAVAQVTPYPWEARREVNEYVEQLSAALAARGHAMLVLAPSGSRSLVRDSRRAIRAAASGPRVTADSGCRDRPRDGAKRPRAGPAGWDGLRADRRGEDDRAGADARTARHPARARALRPERLGGRAAPLARAQRRDVPFTHRAGALDTGRTALHPALLRPPGRPHGDFGRDP